MIQITEQEYERLKRIETAARYLFHAQAAERSLAVTTLRELLGIPRVTLKPEQPAIIEAK